MFSTTTSMTQSHSREPRQVVLEVPHLDAREVRRAGRARRGLHLLERGAPGGGEPVADRAVGEREAGGALLVGRRLRDHVEQQHAEPRVREVRGDGRRPSPPTRAPPPCRSVPWSLAAPRWSHRRAAVRAGLSGLTATVRRNAACRPARRCNADRRRCAWPATPSAPIGRLESRSRDGYAPFWDIVLGPRATARRSTGLGAGSPRCPSPRTAAPSSGPSARAGCGACSRAWRRCSPTSPRSASSTRATRRRSTRSARSCAAGEEVDAFVAAGANGAYLRDHADVPVVVVTASTARRAPGAGAGPQALQPDRGRELPAGGGRARAGDRLLDVTAIEQRPYVTPEDAQGARGRPRRARLRGDRRPGPGLRAGRARRAARRCSSTGSDSLAEAIRQAAEVARLARAEGGRRALLQARAATSSSRAWWRWTATSGSSR